MFIQSVFTLRDASVTDIPQIIEIAEATWFVTYLPFITEAQVRFMYDTIYTPEALTQVMQEERAFSLLIFENENPVGFAMVTPNNQTEGSTKISKIYIKPEMQGKGVGKKLLDAVLEKAKEEKFKKILLNVNRFNEKAILFYEKCNFVKLYEDDIPIGEFWMNDFVMGRDI